MFNWVKDAATNYILVSAMSGWMLAQIIKCFTGVFKARKFSLVNFFFGTGGMPSSHSAAVCALATACGICCGLGSAQFAISAILTVVVMRDAMGMRREVGEHAKTLNAIIKGYQEAHGQKDKIKDAHKELVGHTPLQVFIGGFVGVSCAVAMRFIPVFMSYAP